jgi:uncharacterized delta-60 repeat protein
MSGLRRVALARYDAHGVLDPTFGTAGIVRTVLPRTGGAMALILQPDGRLVVGAAMSVEGRAGFALLRYHADGTLDATFGEAGVASIGLTDGDAELAALVRQPDGGLVAAGTSDRRLALARWTADGLRDPSFGHGGVVEDRAEQCATATNALAVDARGALITAGTSTTGDRAFRALHHVFPDGAIDPDFPPADATDGCARCDTDTATRSQRLVVRAAPDGTWRIATDAVLAHAVAAMLRPDRGLRVLVRDRDGTPLVDAVTRAGARSADERSGWRARSRGRWVYRGPTVAGAIDRVRVDVDGRHVHVDLRGRDLGNVPQATDGAPASAVLSFASEMTARVCLHATWTAPETGATRCRVRQARVRLLCR